MSENIDIAINARDNAMATLRDLNRELQETGRLNKDQMQTLRQVRQEVMANNRVINTMREAYRDQHQTLELTGRAFQSLGIVVNKAQTMYTQYNVAMIRTSQLQKEVRDAQEKYNEAVAKFGPDSAQARKAQEELAESTQKLAQAQQQNTMQMIGFVTQIPGLVTGVSKVVTEFKVLAEHLKTADIVGWASGGAAAIKAFAASAVADLALLGAALGSIVAAAAVAWYSVTQVHAPMKKIADQANLTAREYSAFLRVCQEMGLSVDQLTEKIIKNEISLSDLSEYGEIAVSAVTKIKKAYESMQPGQLKPPTTVTATTTTTTTTTDLEDMQKRLASLKEDLQKVREAYATGQISEEEYRVEALTLQKAISDLETKIAFITQTTKKQTDAFDDLTDSMKRTNTVKRSLESNFGALSGMMGQNAGVAGNLSGVFANLGSQVQWVNSMLGQFGPTQQFIGGTIRTAANIQVPTVSGMPPALTDGQWQQLGSMSSNMLQTAANIQPTKMISTAATAVAPILNQMPALANQAQNMIKVATQTAQTMVPAMLGMGNIPIVNQMLAGAASMGLPTPTLPPPTTTAPPPTQPWWGNLWGLLPLQEGGIVRKPTLAMLGEREEEAVIPLSRAPALMNTMNIPITIRSMQVSDRRQVMSFFRELENTIIRGSARRGRI